jgi:hypothetical protein
MAKVWDLVDPATRALMAAAVDGDSEAEEAARSLLPTRHHDAVKDCPAVLLPDLVERFPELADRVVAERGEELQQL